MAIGQKIISNGDIIKLAAEIHLLSDEKSNLKNGHYKIGQFEMLDALRVKARGCFQISRGCFLLLVSVSLFSLH